MSKLQDLKAELKTGREGSLTDTYFGEGCTVKILNEQTFTITMPKFAEIPNKATIVNFLNELNSNIGLNFKRILAAKNEITTLRFDSVTL